MRQAVLNVDHETLAAFGFDVFQEAGLRDVEILSCEGPQGVSRLSLADRPDERRLDDLDTVRWWEHVSTEGSTHVYVVEMSVSERLTTCGVDPDGVARAERAEVTERGLSFDQAGSQEALGETFAEMQAAGFGVSLEKLHDYRVRETPLDALTDRQREVVEVAYDRGYYDVPRRASTAEIAAELDVDDSTVSEHLRRGERNLLGFLLD